MHPRTDAHHFPPAIPALAALTLLLASLLAQGAATSDQDRPNDNGSPVCGIHDLTFALCHVASAADQDGDPLTGSATAVRENLFMVVPDMDDDDDGDDPSPEKDAETGKTLSVSNKICVRAVSRRISQAAMFHSNLFAPFKSRPPP